jgi:hypothetical protein
MAARVVDPVPQLVCEGREVIDTVEGWMVQDA